MAKVHHEQKWDVIVIDAFYADSIPFHLATHEFLELVRERLSSGWRRRRERDRRAHRRRVEAAPLADEDLSLGLPDGLLYPVYEGVGDRNPTYTRNVILVATDGAAPTTAFLRQRWKAIRKTTPTAPSLDNRDRRPLDRPVRFDDVPVLTDDYAPTDALLTDRRPRGARSARAPGRRRPRHSRRRPRPPPRAPPDARSRPRRRGPPRRPSPRR